MDYFTIALDLTTGKWMSLYLYANVQNTKEIREKLVSGKLQCCVIKASLVTDPFQVAVAVNKAVLRNARSSLTTKTVFTEILYAMSTSNKITDSLVKFGIHDNDRNLIVVLIHDAGDEQRTSLENKILTQIKGDRTPVSRLREFTDESKVRKVYGVHEDELAASNLLDLIVSRMNADSYLAAK